MSIQNDLLTKTNKDIAFYAKVLYTGRDTMVKQLHKERVDLLNKTTSPGIYKPFEEVFTIYQNYGRLREVCIELREAILHPNVSFESFALKAKQLQELLEADLLTPGDLK